MNHRKLLLTTITLLSVVIYFSCRKTDKTLIETKSAIETKFFNEHVSNDEYLQKIMAYVRRQNDKYNFLEKMTSNIGFPYWDRSIVFEPVKSSTRSSGDSANITYIPFVRDSQNFVNASLIVETTTADTSLKVLYDWQYKEYSFNSTASSNKWNAADVFHVFTRFTKEVFGYTDYRINDDMLSKLIYPAAAHGDIKSGNAIVKILPQVSGQKISLLRSPSLCDQFNLCFDQAGDFALCPFNVSRCTTISADQGGGGGTGGSSGSGGTGGGLGGLDGGGKSGTGWQPVPNNPCDQIDNYSGATATLQYSTNLKPTALQFSPFNPNITTQPEQYFVVNNIKWFKCSGHYTDLTCHGRVYTR